MPLSTCEWRRNRVSYTHWVDHDHRVMSCVVRWDKTWTPTLDSAFHVLHGATTGATTWHHLAASWYITRLRRGLHKPPRMSRRENLCCRCVVSTCKSRFNTGANCKGAHTRAGLRVMSSIVEFVLSLWCVSLPKGEGMLLCKPH